MRTDNVREVAADDGHEKAGEYVLFRNDLVIRAENEAAEKARSVPVCCTLQCLSL